MVLYDLHDCTFTGFLLKNMNFVINNEKKVNYSWNPDHCRTTCKVSDTWVSRKIQDFWNLCQWGQRFIVKRLGLNAIGTLFDPNDWIHVRALHSSFPARMNKRTESSCLVILETLRKATWKILHHLVGIIKAKGECHSSPFYLKLISSVSGKFRGRLRISICQDTIGIMLVKQTESDKFLKARNVFLFLINNFRKIFKIICFSNSPVWRSTKN